MFETLADRIVAAPRLASPARALKRFGEIAEALAPYAERKRVAALLCALADHSPFLWPLAAGDPSRLVRLLGAPPEASLAALVGDLVSRVDDEEATLMRALRFARYEAALLVALADLGGVWDVVAATEALTAFADAAVKTALRFLLRAAAAARRLDLDRKDPEKACGLVVLALGKQGARELNYSSDVDLVVFFDGNSKSIAPEVEPAQLFVRLVKGFVRLLQERTADGYALRVDLRLRPDPASNPVAISTASAYAYYETLGQNWERAAMIKARPVAGDIDLGRRFLSDLAPFIWRKYFDYAAIADVHAMKRQIHAVRGHERVAVPGHDVKIGRGGIREIEFFVQTQQLIFGGRRPRLRGARTLDMLKALHAENWVSAEAVHDLSDAYIFLRSVEHRLQMLADEQTQTLPLDPRALARFAKFCGFASRAAFERALTWRLKSVEKHYARLFEEAPTLGAERGNLVFTGVGDDPETIATLRALGFHRAEEAAETIRGWHFGRRAGVRSARAREVLTELIPGLIKAFSGSGDPDAALAAFDAALARMPASVELLSILRSNEKLRELFGDILGSAPRLAAIVATRPHVLDAAIDPGRAVAIVDSLDERQSAQRAQAYLAGARTFEEILDRARDFAAEEKFLIGVRLLSSALSPDAAGRAYSALAQELLDALLRKAIDAFSADHGAVQRGRVAALALGKLGSREMTAASDLDLIIIYDFPDEARDSDGPRPLAPVVYFARLTQRLISALTAPTKRGTLYDVDMRLRPSGRKGPLATRLSAFVQYQSRNAETWEHMALTRARFVAGDAGLGSEIAAVIKGVLSRSRDAAQVADDVVAMRKLIAKEKGDDDPWDLKIAEGGLLDIEFISQFLTLAFASRHPDLLDVSTRQTLVQARRDGLIAEGDADILVDAHRLLTDATQLLRLTIAGRFDPEAAAAGVKRRVANAAGEPDFERLTAALSEARSRVKEVWRRVLG